MPIEPPTLSRPWLSRVGAKSGSRWLTGALFTAWTKATWSSMLHMRWTMPNPPIRAISMAMRSSVHHWVLAEMIGTLRRPRPLSSTPMSASLRLARWVFLGTSSTSSNT